MLILEMDDCSSPHSQKGIDDCYVRKYMVHDCWRF